MKKLLPLLFILSGCADSTTYLKNEKTGEVVKCGGVHAVTLAESAIQRREAQSFRTTRNAASSACLVQIRTDRSADS